MTAMAIEFTPTMRRVERRALFTIKRCVKDLGLKAVPLPIPVESWIERPLGIRFGIGDLSQFGAGALGAAYVRDREILVSDAIKHEGRFRFTAAHELGHIVLHNKSAVLFSDVTEGPHPGEQRLEREADRFAAAFLIPLPILIRAFASACSAVDLSAVSALDGLRCGNTGVIRVWRTEILPRLAARFEVSLAAMANRFTDLKTVDGVAVITVPQLSALRIVGAGSASWLTA